MGLLVQRGNVYIRHSILGSSDLNQEDGFSAKFKARLIGKILFGMFQKGRLPRFIKQQLEKKPADERLYYDKMLDMFALNSTRMSFVKQKSIQNQFYSDLITPIENGISVSGTTVHIFYAAKMGEEYLKRYYRHFENPDIRRHDMQHEELLIGFSEQWAEEVIKCCGV